MQLGSLLKRFEEWVVSETRRVREAYDALSWASWVFWIIVGPTLIVVGPYTIEVSLAGKIFFGFVLLALYALAAHRHSARKHAPPVQTSDDPAYWTLTEAISWIAFGEAAQARGWADLLARMKIDAAEERHRIALAEGLFIRKMQDPRSGVDIIGKEDGRHAVHLPVPRYVFHSDVGLNVFDSRIGMPNRSDLKTIMHWKGPMWSEVRVRQAHVKHVWKGDVGRQTMSLIDAAKLAYGRTRNTVIGMAAEARFGNENKQDGTITWFCYALADRLTIFGNWPPSDVLEQISWKKIRNTHSFRMRDGQLTLQEYGSDSGYFENLYVRMDELHNALSEIDQLAAEPANES